MTQTTFKYNPSRQSEEELAQSFVGRQDLLDGILSELREQRKGSSRQHYVIIGPRGIGKTNLLLMIYYAVKRRPVLSDKWIPVQLAEESYSVLNLADFMLETLKALSEEIEGFDEQIREVSASGDDETVIDRSVDVLRKIADSRSKGILVLVDNLDMILEDQMRDQMEIHRLRSLLMAQDFITIIGTSPTLFNEIANYDSPLYNFFKTINLKELSTEEMEELIARRLTIEGKPDEAQTLVRYRPRLKAIRHLTGGNPRLLLMVYQICEQGAIPEVKQALETLLDELTPYFKHRVESLSPQMRKVLDTLARSDNALTPTEIAREARLDVKMVNVQLARMKDEGLVTATPVRGARNTYYETAERLFRIWYKMRLSRKGRNEVYFLAEFFQAWYEADEMLTVISGLTERFSRTLAQGDESEAQRILESLHIVESASSNLGIRAEAILSESILLQKLAEQAESADPLGCAEDMSESDFSPYLMAMLDLRLSAGQFGVVLKCAEKRFAMLDWSARRWLHYFMGVQQFNYECDRSWTGGVVLLNIVGQVLGALHRDTTALFRHLDEMEAMPDTWMCCGWWLCMLGLFDDASIAYGKAENKARIAGDTELEQIAATSRSASQVLAERTELSDRLTSSREREDSHDLSQQSSVQRQTIMMVHLWMGFEFAVHGFGGSFHVPKVTEVGSPLDLMLRGAADAAKLKTAVNARRVAAQLGSERTEIAEGWIRYYDSVLDLCLDMASIVGLRNGDSDRG